MKTKKRIKDKMSSSSSDLEFRNKLDKLYDSFELLVAKILSGYTKMQKSIGPLSKRDEELVTEYKEFIRIRRKYEKDFYDDMFTKWSKKIISAELIFDEPIDYVVSKREDFFINIPIIHEWGLRNVDSRVHVESLEKILLTIASILHPEEQMANELKNRLRELSPQPQGPRGNPLANLANPNGGLNADALKNMMGGMLNSMKNIPGFQDSIPENFDGNEFTNAVFESDTMTNMFQDIQKGTFSMDKLGSIFEDPKMMEVVNKLNDDGKTEKKPTKFEDLPKELQPPGEPMNASSSTPSNEVSAPLKEKEVSTPSSLQEEKVMEID